MTTREDLERHLWRAITGNRLGEQSHTVGSAIREATRRGGARPWEAVGVSRETWRRWNHPKHPQKPSKKSQDRLTSYLRRSRLSAAQAAKIRAGGISITAWDNYDDQERQIGSASLDWTPSSADRLITAYLDGGADAAADVFLEEISQGSTFFGAWLHPDAHGSTQSFDILSMSLTHDQQGHRVGRRGNRRAGM